MALKRGNTRKLWKMGGMSVAIRKNEAKLSSYEEAFAKIEVGAVCVEVHAADRESAAARAPPCAQAHRTGSAPRRK